MSAFEPFEEFGDIETLAEGLSDPDRRHPPGHA